ncbi:MAG TPA: helix-turn-helix transcriptional regulator [Fontimonas sp.]
MGGLYVLAKRVSATPLAPLRSYAYVWDGVLLFAPRAIVNRRHAHFAATVLIAVDKPFALTLDDGVRRYCDVALLAPNTHRQTDSEGQPLVDFLIDPDDAAYRFLHPLLQQQPVLLLPRESIGASRRRFARLFAGQLRPDEARKLVDEALQALCPRPPDALPWDPRILKAAHYMRSRIPEAVPAIAEIAHQAHLSESRFCHLFRSQMGLPLRQFLLWLRIRHAMKLWAQGKSLGDIAHGAGFYDHAHFTRTLRRMTDYTPSMLTNPALVERYDCD